MKELWSEYSAAWSTPDRVVRHKILEKRLTPDVNYADPESETSGYQELSDYMENFQRGYPGRRFVVSEIIAHHNGCLVHWTMQNGQSEVEMVGASYAELAADGRLRRIRGFFGSASA
jgi:SnoaL-like domain